MHEQPYNKIQHSQLTLLLIIFIDTYGYFLVLPVLLHLFMNPNGLLPHSMTIHARHGYTA